MINMIAHKEIYRQKTLNFLSYSRILYKRYLIDLHANDIEYSPVGSEAHFTKSKLILKKLIPFTSTYACKIMKLHSFESTL